jgi:hypothetical protein
MGLALLALIVTAPDCEPWLLAQIERARQRVGAEQVDIACPAPGVVVVELAAPGTSTRQVRLSGFDEGDRWVGTALIALVEARRSERRAPLIVSAPPPAPAPSPPARVDMIVRPSVALLGPPLQASVGVDALVGVGRVRLGAGAARHQATSPAGNLRATDLLAVLTLPLPLVQLEALTIVLDPGLGVGATLLEGVASEKATEGVAWAPTGRAWVDLGVETTPLPIGLRLSAGVRAGVRVAPAGTVDGLEVLAGTGASAGGYLGIGWTL